MPRKSSNTLLHTPIDDEETGSNSNLLLLSPTSPPISPSCFSLLNYSCTRQSTPEKLPEIYDQWRESQRSSATHLTRQLKCKWALDSLVDNHLAKLRSHYLRRASPLLPSDLPRLLFPSWNPPFLTASLSWLGDTWRPSSILALASPRSPRAQRLLQESIRRFRIEETVLDEEMAEYQSMVVLNLCQRGGTRQKGKRTGGTGMGMDVVCEQMRKVEGVVERAQRMRYKAVEMVVKGGILGETQAAEFLVALAGVEEAVRRQAGRWMVKAGAVTVEVRAFD